MARLGADEAEEAQVELEVLQRHFHRDPGRRRLGPAAGAAKIFMGLGRLDDVDPGRHRVARGTGGQWHLGRRQVLAVDQHRGTGEEGSASMPALAALPFPYRHRTGAGRSPSPGSTRAAMSIWVVARSSLRRSDRASRPPRHPARPGSAWSTSPSHRGTPGRRRSRRRGVLAAETHLGCDLVERAAAVAKSPPRCGVQLQTGLGVMIVHGRYRRHITCEHSSDVIPSMDCVDRVHERDLLLDTTGRHPGSDVLLSPASTAIRPLPGGALRDSDARPGDRALVGGEVENISTIR